MRLTEERCHEEALDLDPLAAEVLNGQDCGVVPCAARYQYDERSQWEKDQRTWNESERGDDDVSNCNLE